MKVCNVAVLGAGAWGSSLSIAISRAGNNVTLLPKFEKERAVLLTTRELPQLGVKFPDSVEIGPCFESLREGSKSCAAMSTQLSTVDAIFWAVPVSYTVDTAKMFAPALADSIPIVICSKGFVWDSEQQEGMLLSEAIGRELNNPICVLSGPNFAKEVASGCHTASVLSSLNIGLCRAVGAMILSPTFRIFISRDMAGVQIAGALKNVLAIACGIISGLKLGNNTKAVVFEQGLSEIVAFVQKYGGTMGTLLGLSGIGDLAMTCFSDASRNTTFGIRLAQGESIKKLLAGMRVEGAETVMPAYAIARNLGLNTPVLDMIYNILYCEASIEASIQFALSEIFS
jgi:glycerol-3-phosphate dehydrogenase (NAD(P)+)